MMMMMKKITSKRNKVILFNSSGKLSIKKIHCSIFTYENEKKFYQSNESIFHLKCAKLIEFDDKNLTLWFEYISGPTLLELVEEYERQDCYTESIEVLLQLIQWLDGFYRTLPGKVIFDIHLKNFILNNDVIYGVDFELIKDGDKRAEIVKLIAMYLNYDPINSDFKLKVVEKVRKYLCENYKYTAEEFESILKHEIDIIKLRRRNKVLK